MAAAQKKIPSWRPPIAALALLPVLPLLLLVALARSVWLHVLIWSQWLFVYSDSPVWRDYCEQRLLPHIRRRAQILNWSERKSWNPSLATMAFAYFGGRREFNPLAVVFRPLRPARVFRFWQAFRDLKHGHPEQLRAIERRFLTTIGAGDIPAPSE